MKATITLVLSLVCLFAIFYPNIYIKDNKLKVYNENNILLNATIYKNYSTINYNRTVEYIVYFTEITNGGLITIAVPPKIIGIPEKPQKITLFDKFIYVPDESKIFTPITEGVYKSINKYTITNSLITFDAFGDLKTLGKQIKIK